MLKLPPLSLYVHIPWCVKKCPYCDFNSHVAKQTIPETDYVNALIEDLKADLHWVQGRKLRSIFFGGGTPSLFSGAAIGTILQAAENLIGFESDIEVTLEANPGVAEQKKFADFYNAGVNRLSVGVQSFNDNHLKRLGRIHGSSQAISAIAMAQSAGFDNFNVDLMHGLPEQTVAEAENDIIKAADSGAIHISWYQLTIEPNTEFFSRPPLLPVDDRLADIQQAGMVMLNNKGYQQYEVSAFAKNAMQSHHNINYWQFGDYLGVGAGAHGKITLPTQNEIIRTAKTRQPDHYLAKLGSPEILSKAISLDEMAQEFMMNGLRLKQGVSREYFTQRTGLDFHSVDKIVLRLQSQGLLEQDTDRYRTTPLGYQFLNSVLQNF
ncbi:radical SAM family heme chaperone HemW [Porticoccaceae bacterium]|nr:radical SAM family heme chaperone HemW [Porticoccaceae bacterium]MDB2669860.1 radical SAM family heme chaperone HemW [Porticoccaceae bacterium]MDC0523884.1 radical SAM family heme chaperone HemW [Porticoccaceae bacterium]